MKNIITYLFVLLISTLSFMGCSSESDSVYIIELTNIKTNSDLVIGGILFENDMKPYDNSLMISSSQFSPYFKKTINGIEYSIAYNKKTKKIIYISTIDIQFKTPEGYKVMVSFDI